MLLQVSLVKPIMGLTPNLAFATIIAFASLGSFFETILASLIFATLTTNFSYNSQILWVYVLIALIAVKFNPDNIADKFIVCLGYSLLLTPMLEIFNPMHTDFLERITSAELSNLVSSALMFFVVKLFFSTNKKANPYY